VLETGINLTAYISFVAFIFNALLYKVNIDMTGVTLIMFIKVGPKMATAFDCPHY